MGTKMAILVNMHTKVAMESKVWPVTREGERGRSVIKSIETCDQGRVGIGWGWRRPGGRRVDGLIRWQVAHDLT